LRNEFDAADYFKNHLDWTKARWIAPGWGYIDPEKEINASITAIDNNLSSLADECAAHGRDYEEIMQQRAREEKLRKSLGLEKAQPKPALAGAGKPEKNTPDPGEPPDPDADPLKDPDNEEDINDATNRRKIA